MKDEHGRDEDPLGLGTSSLAARRHQTVPNVLSSDTSALEYSASSSAADASAATRAKRAPSPISTRQQRSNVSSPPPRPRSPGARRPQSPPTNASAADRSWTARRESASMQGMQTRPAASFSAHDRPASPRSRGSAVSWQQSGLQSHVQDVSQDQPNPAVLQQFAETCRQLYFDKSAQAAQTIDATLSKLPQHHRTPFAKTMAVVRAQYHANEQATKKAAVLELLASTEPGQVVKDVLNVNDGGTRAMRSPVAKTLRRNRLKAFVDEHCIKAMPGTHPFFKSLYCALLLQATPDSAGGAEARRVEWQIDLAVFAEASVGSWMKDSIELLKGVLGCSEQNIPSNQKIDGNDSAASPLDRPDPLSTRGRAFSDPFLDPNDRVTGTEHSQDPLTPTSPVSPSLTTESPLLPLKTEAAASRQTSTRDDIRIFVLPPYITNPELIALCRLFPEFITSRTRLAKFVDVVEDGSMLEGSTMKPSRGTVVSAQARLPATMKQKVGPAPGHGEVRVSDSERDPGWRGTLLERFILWLKKLFGLL
ncbi:hypothetical protein OIV83_001282 [Microbotryomycetes sp. JL201]|nr:hypothetical protein OIV83_001282 [Microbotryomycetes sp. JL201]